MGFLNETGLQRVWEHILAKLNLKADKTEIEALQTALDSKSDWNQNDTTAVDYIKNRTHWEEEEVTYSFEHTFTWNEEEWEYPAVENNGFQLVDGVIYTVTINEVTLPCKAKENDLYFLPSNPEASLRYPTDEETAYGVVQYGDYRFACLSDGTLWLSGFGYSEVHSSPLQPLDSVNVSITGTAGGIHKLSSKFLNIDNEVVAESENPVSGMAVFNYVAENSRTQPDWNQHDETQPDYVKNRTHWEKTEIVTLLDNQVLTYDYGSIEYFVSSNHEIVLISGVTYDVTIDGITLQCEAYGDYGDLISFDFGFSEDLSYQGVYDSYDGYFTIIDDNWASDDPDYAPKEQITVSIVGPNHQVKTLPSYFLNLEEEEAKRQLSKISVPLTGGTMKGVLYAGSSFQRPEASLLRNSKILSSEKTPTTNGEIYWTYE